MTRYAGPTDHRPSRIIATHKRDSEKTWRVTMPWDHAISPERNHAAAAEALIARYWPNADLRIAARGHDHDRYAWTAVGAWQLGSRADDLLRSIADALWGDGADTPWSADTLDSIADAIRLQRPDLTPIVD
jgi:hypothetical protein